MEMIIKRGWILILLLPVISLSSWATLPIHRDPNAVPSLAGMLRRVTPAVVNVRVVKKLPRRSTIGVGSGVIINSRQGIIVTNAHVVARHKLIIVTLKNGRRYRAHLIGKDDGFDIAVLQIVAPNLVELTLGNSNQLQPGDFVAAIGSPFGLTQTVTSGVISALNRDWPKIEGYQSFIQTDAPINPGNSGGALVNLKGQLIGINTAILTSNYGNVGIGFAIPSNIVRGVVAQLLRYGEVKHGMLGVIAQQLSPALADALGLQASHGVLVTKVIPGSAASAAGIVVKDTILEVNGEKIHSPTQLRNRLAVMRPGMPLRILIQHQRKSRLLKTKVGDPKALKVQQRLPLLAGLQLRQFDALEANGERRRGVLIARLLPGSQGMLAGLLPGDIVVAANAEPVTSVDALVQQVRRKPHHLLLKIVRGNSDMFVVIEPTTAIKKGQSKNRLALSSGH